MDVVESQLEKLRKEFIETFVTKEILDSMDYRIKRLIGDVDRKNQNQSDELNSLKQLVN